MQNFQPRKKSSSYQPNSNLLNQRERSQTLHYLQLMHIQQGQAVIIQPKPQDVPYSKTKNLFKLTLVIFVISLSAFYCGYSFTYFSTIPPSTLLQFYGAPIGDEIITIFVLVLVQGLGGLFGSLIAYIVIRYYSSRRNFLVFLNIIAFIVNLIIQITNIWVFIIFRFINGILVSLYLSCIPSYIKQLSPPSLSGIFGAFTQILHALGSVSANFVGMIFYLYDYQGEFFIRFQLQFTSIFIVFQTGIILLGYIPESPNSLMQMKKFKQGKQVLEMFNSQVQIQRIIKQKFQQNDQVQHQPQSQIFDEFEVDTLKETLLKRDKTLHITIKMNWKSYFLAFLIPFSLQMSGSSVIPTYMGDIIAIYNPRLSHYSNVINSAVLTIASALFLLISARVGRRPIILIGTLGLAIINGVIGLLFFGIKNFAWFSGIPLLLAFFIIFSIFYGLFLGPIVAIYVTDITKRQIVPLALIVFWIGNIFISFVPIITEKMGSPYGIFIFLSILQFIFFLIDYCLVIETKGLSSLQISKKFQDRE